MMIGDTERRAEMSGPSLSGSGRDPQDGQGWCVKRRGKERKLLP